MTRTLELLEIQESLRDLVTRVRSGTEIILTENHLPVARIVGADTASCSGRRVAGLHRGAMILRDGFDEPLPETFWTGEE